MIRLLNMRADIELGGKKILVVARAISAFIIFIITLIVGELQNLQNCSS